MVNCFSFCQALNFLKKNPEKMSMELLNNIGVLHFERGEHEVCLNVVLNNHWVLTLLECSLCGIVHFLTILCRFCFFSLHNRLLKRL